MKLLKKQITEAWIARKCCERGRRAGVNEGRGAGIRLRNRGSVQPYVVGCPNRIRRGRIENIGSTFFLPRARGRF